MKIVPFIYDDFDDLFANTYVLIDDSLACLVIDPSKKYEGIINYIEKNGLTLKGVLLTHGHFDHMRGVDLLLNKYHVPLYIGFYDADALKDSRKNLSYLMGREEMVVEEEPITVSDREVLHILEEDIEVIYTPFHTKGSVCYYLKDSKALFSGDTLFRYSIGRDDFPNSLPKEKKASLAKLMALPEDTKVYPGHGSFTKIGEERNNNPFVN